MQTVRVSQLTQLTPTSLRHEARKSIRAGVITGELLASEIYPVSYFASELGVSATPIREALSDLVNEGLMEVVRNRGFRVLKLTERDLDEIFELRLMLEVPGVGHIAGHLGAEDLDVARRLARETQECAEKGELSGFLDADRKFHLHLLGFAGNERLVEIVARLRDQTRLHGLRQLAESGRIVWAANEHFEILGDVEQGNAASAQDRVRRHLVHTRGVWAGRAEAETT